MKFCFEPVAYVRCERKEIKDDEWSAVESWIELSEDIPEEAIKNIELFSHLEIIFVFDQLDKNRVVKHLARPRSNPAWPEMGIFAQRKKNRPNPIGLTTVKIEEVNGRKIKVKNLDAIDGTPILDIKPVMKAFSPVLSEIREPEWVAELMRNYF